MQITVEGILLLLFLLVPGAHARSTSLSTTPVAASSSGSRLQELVEVLIYSVGVGATAAASIAVFAVAYLNGAEELRQLARDGIAVYFSAKPIVSLMFLVAYFVLALGLAEIVGATRVAHDFRQAVAHYLFYEDDDWTSEPIWSWAIEQLRGFDCRPQLARAQVAIRARMNDGGVYLGRLVQWPILGDDQRNKDFILRDVLRKGPSDSHFTSTRADAYVLLNASDCLAIEMYRLQGARRRFAARAEARVHFVFWTIGFLVWLASYLSLLSLSPRDRLVDALIVASSLACAATVAAAVRVLLRRSGKWWTPWVVPAWCVGLALVAVGLSAIAVAFPVGVGLVLIGVLVFVSALVRGRDLADTRAARPRFRPIGSIHDLAEGLPITSFSA